jgi:hypothetical protein
MTAALFVLLACVTACGDDDGDGGGAAGGDGSAAGEATLWECTCVGMMEQAGGGEPRTSEEMISECSDADPTEALSQRYDTAASAQGPEFSGECRDCADTGASCDPDAD